MKAVKQIPRQNSRVTHSSRQPYTHEADFDIDCLTPGTVVDRLIVTLLFELGLLHHSES